MLQGLAEIICNATEDESQRVILNDFSEIENNLEPIEAYHQRLDEIKRMEFEESLEHDKQVRNRQLQRVLKKQK